MLYPCRECGEQISSGATRCPHCGAPPRPPLYGRPLSHRLALRAGLVIVLSLPVMMLPLVLRWHNGSWNPCEWRPDGAAAATTSAAPVTALVPATGEGPNPAEPSAGQCLRDWLDRAAL